MRDKKATIYHNPNCGTSRKVHTILVDRGYELDVIKYMDAGLSSADILAMMFKLENKEMILRTTEDAYQNLKVKPETDQQIADAIAKNPRIMQRPVVIIEETGIVARPVEFFETWLDQKEEPRD